METKPIHYDSPEAATPVQVTAWRDVHGLLHLDEHVCRINSADTGKCERCWCDVPVYLTLCNICRVANEAEAWAKLPAVKWDGKMPLFDNDGEYLPFADDIEEYVEDHPDAMLLASRPLRIQEVEVEALIGDMRCDDGHEVELPDSVWRALEVLNDEIRESGPVAYEPSNERIDMDDLRKRMGIQEDGQ